MEYVYSAMLLHSAGKQINEKSVTEVLKAAGVKTDKARVAALTASLEGVDIEEAIATAAAAPVAAAPAPGGEAAPAAQAEAAAEEEAEEEEEEVSEEDAMSGLSSLFG